MPQQKLLCIDDKSLAVELKLPLKSLGKWIRVQDVVDYLSIPENLAHLQFTKPISLRTAQQWMDKLSYRWKKEPTGQYSDSHEHDNVVCYHQNVFIPAWNDYQQQMQKWKEDDIAVEDSKTINSAGHRVVMWFHDESTFYANDQRKQRWVHKSKGALPQPKREGASLMVAHFVSADYGWLCSPGDLEESAIVLFKAGKSRDGYFTNDNIVAHARQAMDILEKHYSNEDHVLVFDNATTHLKRADDALTACRMPKGPSAIWAISKVSCDNKGNLILGDNGWPVKEKVRMSDEHLSDGTPQSLYFPEGHEKAGWFKGMAQILSERGYGNASRLKTECKDFKCPANTVDCCCRRLLYTQPDFTNVESLLEITCCRRGFDVIFLPKFHYCLSSEADLERNVKNLLNAVPVLSMWRFVDAYNKGLSGAQAAWAIKKYCGHRILPDSIMHQFDAAAPATHSLNFPLPH
ncbi:hypothetical protein EV363DRAFT_1396310 [Boletus edulis]|nr:hypothetical protein EV363DRAFT_1396310 [Boletus edulis]